MPEKCSNQHTIALISHTSKAMLKILQTWFQQYVNYELPDVQARFRKGRGTWDQISNILWIIKKSKIAQKNIYFCFIDYAIAFDCMDNNKLWKILQARGTPDHLTYLLRNLCAGQEVRTRHGTIDLGNECIKTVYYYPAYLTYIHSTSCEMLGWKKHKLKSRLSREISITSNIHMTPLSWQNVKN